MLLSDSTLSCAPPLLGLSRGWCIDCVWLSWHYLQYQASDAAPKGSAKETLCIRAQITHAHTHTSTSIKHTFPNIVIDATWSILQFQTNETCIHTRIQNHCLHPSTPLYVQLPSDFARAAELPRCAHTDVFHCAHFHTHPSLNNYASSLILFPSHLLSIPKEIIKKPRCSLWYSPAAWKLFVLCACKVLALRGSTGLARDIYLSLLKHIYTAHTYCTVVAIVTTTAHALIMHPSKIIATYRKGNMSIISIHCFRKQFDTCIIPENMQTSDLLTLSLIWGTLLPAIALNVWCWIIHMDVFPKTPGCIKNTNPSFYDAKIHFRAEMFSFF